MSDEHGLLPADNPAQAIRIVELESENQELKTTIDELRHLNKHIINVREDTLRRIASDIHDDLGQRLTGINLGLQWLLSVNQTEFEMVQSEIQSLIKMNSEIIGTIRSIASRLRPNQIDDLGLKAALAWLIADIDKYGGPTFTLAYEVGKYVLPPYKALALFRIAQECISNILKHSRATHVALTVKIQEDQLILSIMDNGIGFAPGKKQQGNSMGLIDMQERASQMGGRFSISSEPGIGTKVEVVVPPLSSLENDND